MVLSARDNVADTVRGLESGADDYIRKPFGFDVRLRLKAPGSQPEERMLRVGDLALDVLTRRVALNGGESEVELTAASSPWRRCSSGTPVRS